MQRGKFNKIKECLFYTKKCFLGGIEMPFLAIISMIASVLFYVLIAITMLRLLKALDIYIKKNKD
jgi:hypothetical protein